MSTKCTIAVHVSPKSAHDEIVGVRKFDDGLQEIEVRVSAAPDKGAANKATCKLIAKELGIGKTAVSVKHGETSRHKRIEISHSASEIQAWVLSLPKLGV